MRPAAAEEPARALCEVLTALSQLRGAGGVRPLSAAPGRTDQEPVMRTAPTKPMGAITKS